MNNRGRGPFLLVCMKFCEWIFCVHSEKVFEISPPIWYHVKKNKTKQNKTKITQAKRNPKKAEN